VIWAATGQITALDAHSSWETWVRRLFTAEEAAFGGMSRATLRWGERTGRWRRIDRNVFVEGAENPTPLERAVAAVLATGGVASAALAGVLLGLDSVTLHGRVVTVPPTHSGRRPGVTRRVLRPEHVTTVRGIPCTDGLQTLVDLSAVLDDRRWEQALESALRKRLTSIAEVEAALDGMHRRQPGRSRMGRVLALRPALAPPTESLLETLMVQLARVVRSIGPPTRQLVVVDSHEGFVARVDLAWPELGLFIELDGEHHRDQPVYDASRETAVVAATGWLCGRFTWTEVVRHPEHTRRRLTQLVEQAKRRPLGR
jgi:hypothetical protein